MGRSQYEYVARAIKKMQELKGGKAAAEILLRFFRTEYKNRRAMMEVLGKI